MINKAQLAKRVLVVDDLPSARTLVSDMLREMGFTNIAEASSTIEAIRSLQQDKPGLVICDYLMQGMTGTDLVKVLRSEPDLTRVPMIMMSNHRDVPLIDKAICAGVDDYIVKPVSFHILKRRILDVIGRGEDKDATSSKVAPGTE